ncbi:TRASH domain-containing protein [bacterium]|nr:TRASH domain-containing protein [bacterium]
MQKFITLLIFITASIATFAYSYDISWKIVPNEMVCMVTEAYFSKPQIPVKVGNKTYYGCCEGCKKTLTVDKTARTATDPLTKKSVDKATAIIAANNAGNVLYFESKANFEKYMKQQHVGH